MSPVKAHAYLSWVRREAVSLVSIGLLIGVAVGVVVGVANVASLDGRVAGILRLKKENASMRLEEPVTVGTRTITVITIQGEGPGVPADESVDQAIARHHANVAKVQASGG